MIPIRYITNDELELRLSELPEKQRPEYLAELEQIIISRNDNGFKINRARPMWALMHQKYKRQRRVWESHNKRAIQTKAVPRDQWPMRFRIIAKFGKPPDKGIGDTVKRMIDAGGGGWLKDLDCSGCKGRRNRWNALYPYKWPSSHSFS